MSITTREAGRQIITALVSRYQTNRADYLRLASRYNETQLRNDFLNDLLIALGWDVHNHSNAPQRLREVLVEESVAVVDDDRILQKKPDYTLRAGDARKFFVEAKKPSVSVLTAPDPAFQVRRYGWNAGMAVSVLTNFDHLILYDCRLRPQPGDDASVARLKTYAYTELNTRFDELYDDLSREAVYSGRFDVLFEVGTLHTGIEPFDRYFLRQIERWREKLARSLAVANPKLGEAELNFLVQRLINRIVFLRICEDRERSHHEALKNVQTYAQLKALFHEADRRYNSGLFDFLEDTLSLRVEVDGEVLIDIFSELYFPKSAYDFSVVETSILGDIYEQFLAREIALSADRAVGLVEKPEVVQSDGVVTTPKYIVERLIVQALAPRCQGKSPQEMSTLRLADIACGSGVFLVAAYQFLMDYHLEWYVANGAAQHPDQVRTTSDGQYHVTLAEKQRILTNAIYGVDIDIQAVEIARFSLMLKVLEGENAASIDLHLQQHRQRALPNLTRNIQCGNSLVDNGYYEYDQAGPGGAAQLVTVNPFDWRQAFPVVFQAGGFDVILGNPPYIRMQNMVRFALHEVGYYRSSQAGYTTARSDNFDKHALFLERALTLLNPTGMLGYIVPHKFCSTRAGASLRRLLAHHRTVARIVHFGTQQVFPGRSTYTCLLVLGDRESASFEVEHVEDLRAWHYGQAGTTEIYAKDTLGEAPWIFLPPKAQGLFECWRTTRATRALGDVADIFVGVQTSNDRFYILRPTLETSHIVQFSDIEGTTRSIERSILRPCLLDVPIPPFGTPQPNTYILFPYRIETGRAILYTEEQMEAQFPLAWEYLMAHQETLARRNMSNRTTRNWYQYGRVQSLSRFPSVPKLIWPVLSTEPRYAYDAQDIIFTGGGNGPYYALRAKSGECLSLHFLQAILSHPMSELMVRARASMFRGGYVSHGKQFLVDLPIRALDMDMASERETHDAIVVIVQQLIQATEQSTATLVPHLRTVAERRAMFLRQQMNQQIEKLYGMVPEDRILLDTLTASDSADT